MKCLLINRVAFPMSREDVRYSVSIQVISKSTTITTGIVVKRNLPITQENSSCGLATQAAKETKREHLEAQELHNYVL